MNSIYKHVKIVFLLSIWHESGSRVIQESYSNGIPVICFNTGGNKEFIGNNNDIFTIPTLYKDKNNRLRIRNWDNQKMFERITYLFENEKFYDAYSQEIRRRHNYEKKDKEFKEALSKLILNIESI